jgi:hypothetical protein
MCDKNKWACPHFCLANKNPIFIYLVLKFEMLSVSVFVHFMWLLCFLFLRICDKFYLIVSCVLGSAPYAFNEFALLV